MRKLLFTIICFVITVTINAQCSHTFRMIDSWGDGWNGSTVDILVNGNVVLNDVTAADAGGFNTASSEDISFTASSGDDISIADWFEGSYIGEVSWEILDGNGNLLATGFYGDETTVTANCPSSCNEVLTINTTNLTDSSVDIDWAANSSANSWTVEYGTSGFTLGTGTTNNEGSNTSSLSGLTSSTSYDVYIQTLCDGETSNWAGPFSIYIPSGDICGSYTLRLIDSYGDGWQGNTMDLIVNGNTIFDDITLASGYENSLTFQVAEGDAITTLWNGGGTWGSETSYQILDIEGNAVSSQAESSITNADPIIVICPCEIQELISATFSDECASDLTYNVVVSVSDLGSGSSFLDILNNDVVEISGVGTGSHTITGLSGTNVIKLTNENGCSISQTFDTICSACTISSAPSDEPCDAPSVDLSQPFFGSTACSYDVSLGGSKNGPDNFCASANNDSWLLFTAAAENVVLDWEVEYDNPGGYDPIDGFPSGPCGWGVQFASFAGDCNDEDNMTLLACFNPASPISPSEPGWSFQSEGSFEIENLEIGTEYFIYIDGYAGDECNYSWTPQGGVAITPPNDTCPNATLINCGDLDTSNNILATNIDAPQACPGSTPGAGVWYKFVGDGSAVTISTDNTATNYDTQLFLFSGDCDNLDCIGSDDNSGTGETSEIDFIANIGTDYYVYVTGDGSSIGQFGLSVTCVDCQAEPGNWD